ncbi:MAG: cytochrome P450 [Trebouxia sp. A1-2]|nr:MAG: cytochrome P450 [Trebouxia sp. A1-2]
MTCDDSQYWMLLLGSLLAGAAGLLIWRFARSRILYDLHKIPGPVGWPLLGNTMDIIGSKSLHFHQRAPHYSLLGTPDYEEWKSFRKTCSLAFSPDNMRKAYPKIYQSILQGSAAVQQICKHGLVDVSSLAMRLTAEVIGVFGFEQEYHALKVETGSDGKPRFTHQPFLENVRVQLDWSALTFGSPWYKLLYAVMPWLAGARQVRNGIQGVRQNEDNLAHEFKKRGVQPLDNTSLWACLGRLIDYKDGKPAHHDSLAMNTGLFFVADYETTAHTITFALLELASHKAERVRQELDAAGLVPTAQQLQPRDLQFADLSKLPVLESVIKETLRLHPTGPLGTFRITDRDMIIGGYRVPKDTPVQLPPYPMHLSCANFVQPHKFWPERWAQQMPAFSPDKEHPDATPAGNCRNLSASWNAFSCGPKNCIGQALALTEARTALAVLVANFHFDLPEGFSRDQFVKHEQVWRITLQPMSQLHLKITPVHQAL